MTTSLANMVKVLLALTALLSRFASALWPIPSSYSPGTSMLWIDRDVEISYNLELQECVGSATGEGILADLYPESSRNDCGIGLSQEIVNTAIQRAFSTIFDTNFVPWKFNPRTSSYEPTLSDNGYITSITLRQNEIDPTEIGSGHSAPDESYTVSMPLSGHVLITANSSVGLSYGLTTFSQLFFQHSKGGAYTQLAPTMIVDAPMFSHRGLNLDTSRNFFSVADLKRTLDAMAFTKLNRLHWHVTDAQSWPLEISALPELSAAGAYAPNLVYSPGDVTEIMQYGNMLGIETVVEIDMPGSLRCASHHS